MSKRVDLHKILNDPYLRRELMVQGLIAIQAREGIVTTREQAEKVYDDYHRTKPSEWGRLSPAQEKGPFT